MSLKYDLLEIAERPAISLFLDGVHRYVSMQPIGNLLDFSNGEEPISNKGEPV
jgi:hypothetical protein